VAKRNMKPGEIKALLEERGLNFALLAARAGHGVTRQQLANAIVRPSTRSEIIIAKALDLPPATIWPARYEPNGKRKARQPLESYHPAPRFRRSVKEL
jgi:Ner family transcriptional regulator